MKKIIKGAVFFFGVGFLASCSVTPNQEKPQVTVEVKPHMHELPAEDQAPPIIIEQQVEPKWVEKRALSHKERFSGTLQAHNRIRAKHRLPPLTWSNRLANYSQQWANQLGRGNHCQMYHRKKTIFGENLYRSTAIIWTDGRREINPVSIKNVVKAWTDEEKWYDYSRNRCQPGQQCGHYTQAVWKTTKQVGCAMKVCADKSQVWVCSYNPPGNYIGLRPY